MQLIFARNKPILHSQPPKRLTLDPRADAVSVYCRLWLRDRAATYGAIPARV